MGNGGHRVILNLIPEEFVDIDTVNMIRRAFWLEELDCVRAVE